MTTQHDKAKRWQFGIRDVAVGVAQIALWFAICVWATPNRYGDAELHMMTGALCGLVVGYAALWCLRSRYAFCCGFWVVAVTQYFILPYATRAR
jgi:hypothetical protein